MAKTNQTRSIVVCGVVASVLLIALVVTSDVVTSKTFNLFGRSQAQSGLGGPRAVPLEDSIGQGKNTAPVGGFGTSNADPATNRASELRAFAFGGTTSPFVGMRAVADELWEEGKYQEVLLVLQSIIAAAPPGFDRAEAHRMMGVLLYLLADFPAAAAALELAVTESLALDRGEYYVLSPLNMLGNVVELRGDPERSLVLFKQLTDLALKVENVEFAGIGMGQTANLLRKLNRPLEEAAAIRRLLAAFPERDRDTGAGQAHNVLRLSQLERGSDFQASAQMLRDLLAEPWLTDTEARDSVRLGLARMHINGRDNAVGVQIAVESTNNWQPQAGREMPRFISQMFVIIVDNPQLVTTTQLRRALELLASQETIELVRNDLARRLRELP